MGNKCVIAGSTGLTGQAVLQKVLIDSYFTKIYTLVRHNTSSSDGKVIETLVDFDKLNALPNADTLIICLGTTRKKAGSKDAFKTVDFSYVIKLAKLAEQAHYNSLIVISSYGANSDSGNFYLKIKGQMEDEIRTMKIEQKAIIRPSLLMGKRNEFRFGERLASYIMKAINPILKGPLLKYKAVYDWQVANAILKISKESFTGTKVFEPEWIHRNT